MTNYKSEIKDFINNYYYKNYNNNFNNKINYELDFEEVINYDIIYESIYDMMYDNLEPDIRYKLEQFKDLDLDKFKIKFDTLFLTNINKDIDFNLIIDLFLDPDLYNN